MVWIIQNLHYFNFSIFRCQFCQKDRKRPASYFHLKGVSLTHCFRRNHMVPCDWNPLSGSWDGMPSWIPHILKHPQHCAFCLFERFKCPFKHFQHSCIHQTVWLLSNMSFRYEDEALRHLFFWKMPLDDAGTQFVKPSSRPQFWTMARASSKV